MPTVAARYGGPSATIWPLVRGLNRICGLEAEIATTDADGPGKRISPKSLPTDVPLHVFPRSLSEQWKISFTMGQWLSRNVQNYDVVHIHGIWSFSTSVAARAACRRNIPYIIRPAGMLSTWSLAHKRLKKRVAWSVFHRRDLTRASVIHATCADEARDIDRLRLHKAIAIIPNGVGFPETRQCANRFRDVKQALFVGRLHPVKGLANLLYAWERVDPLGKWELVLVGPDDIGYRAELEQLAAKLKIVDRVKFVGPLFDDDKWKTYSCSDLFVLPSFTENFSASVAEALACGLPVITTTGTPWREVNERKCGWCVEPTVDAISAALREAIALSDEERISMGQRGSDWVRTSFSWDGIVADLHELYRWLIEGGSAPRSIISDENVMSQSGRDSKV
jgi:glycosyltransferase involved in cell wall biosynthesis